MFPSWWGGKDFPRKWHLIWSKHNRVVSQAKKGHGTQGTRHACQHGARSSPRINQINKAKQCGVEGAWVRVKCRVHSSPQEAELGAFGFSLHSPWTPEDFEMAWFSKGFFRTLVGKWWCSSSILLLWQTLTNKQLRGSRGLCQGRNSIRNLKHKPWRNAAHRINTYAQ